MISALTMFPQASYKYGILIPVIALLIEGHYSIGNNTYELTPYDRMCLESFHFFRDENGNVSYRQFYPDFASIGAAVSLSNYDSLEDYKHCYSVGMNTHLEYIDKKRYASIQFITCSNYVVSVNIMKNGNINDAINRICNLIGATTNNERTEFYQILTASRMIMAA